MHQQISHLLWPQRQDQEFLKEWQSAKHKHQTKCYEITQNWDHRFNVLNSALANTMRGAERVITLGVSRPNLQSCLDFSSYNNRTVDPSCERIKSAICVLSHRDIEFWQVHPNKPNKDCLKYWSMNICHIIIKVLSRIFAAWVVLDYLEVLIIIGLVSKRKSLLCIQLLEFFVIEINNEIAICFLAIHFSSSNTRKLKAPNKQHRKNQALKDKTQYT